MGIDIYLRWKDQTEEEKEAQYKGDSLLDASYAGYLRESYHGGPYATKVLFPEIFGLDMADPELGIEVTDQWSAKYPAAVLEARLPETLATVIERCKVVYKEELTEADPFVQAYVNFVALAKRKEAETGEPCEVEASY